MGLDPVPVGWHPDPYGRHEVRYSDGRRWTDHVADAGVATLDPPVPTGAEGLAPGVGVGGAPPFTSPERPWPSTPPLWDPVVAVEPESPPRRRTVPLALVWSASLLAVVLVATLVAVNLRDDASNRDRSGHFEASVAGVTDVDRFDVELDAGDVLAITVTPDRPLDVVIGYAADRVTTEAGFQVLSGTPPSPDDVATHLKGLRNDDIAFSDVAPEHGLYVLATVDVEREGGAEHVAVLAGGHGTYAVLVRGYGTTLGDYEVDMERTTARALLADRTRFAELFAGSELTFERYADLFQE